MDTTEFLDKLYCPKCRCSADFSLTLECKVAVSFGEPELELYSLAKENVRHCVCSACGHSGTMEEFTAGPDRDDSNVREVLSDEPMYRADKPWLFDARNYQGFYATEVEACARQRDYRSAHNFDPITGERV